MSDEWAYKYILFTEYFRIAILKKEMMHFKKQYKMPLILIEIKNRKGIITGYGIFK